MSSEDLSNRTARVRGPRPAAIPVCAGCHDMFGVVVAEWPVTALVTPAAPAACAWCGGPADVLVSPDPSAASASLEVDLTGGGCSVTVTGTVDPQALEVVADEIATCAGGRELRLDLRAAAFVRPATLDMLVRAITETVVPAGTTLVVQPERLDGRVRRAARGWRLVAEPPCA